MYERNSTSSILSIVKWVVIIGAIVFIANLVINYFKVTDVTPYINADKSRIEDELNVSLTSNPNMLNKIYEYTDAEVTVEGGEDGIAIVYIDELRAGLHIDNRKYSMYEVNIGDSKYDAESSMTFEYDDTFEILDDMADGTSTAAFYTNSTDNTCLVLVFNDISNRVVAITYYNDMNEVTKRLSSI